MYFRFLFTLFLLLNTFHVYGQNDVLRTRILEYNKSKYHAINKLDSTKLFIDLNYLNNIKGRSYIVQIIKKRNILYNYNFFFYILTTLFIISLIRYSSGISLHYQLIQFLKLRIKLSEEYGFVKSLLINVIFISLLGYIIFRLFNIVLQTFDNSASFGLYVCIVIALTSYIFFKYIINYFVIKIFGLKNKIMKIKYVMLDYMYIFVSIALPLTLVSTIVNTTSHNIIMISIGGLLILLYLFVLLKIYSQHLNLLTNNVMKFIIYFYAVEIIPILLLIKYLKTFSVS